MSSSAQAVPTGCDSQGMDGAQLRRDVCDCHVPGIQRLSSDVDLAVGSRSRQRRYLGVLGSSVALYRSDSSSQAHAAGQNCCRAGAIKGAIA